MTHKKGWHWSLGEERQGHCHGGVEGTLPPLLTKVIYVNRLKQTRKIENIEGMGDDVTNQTW